MRLFVAIELPQAVRRKIASVTGGLQPQLPPARWVDPANLHLTLLFLGEVDDDLAQPLEEALAPAFAAHQPFKIQVLGGGTFPPRKPGRTAWLGIAAPGPQLAQLQSGVAKAALAVTGGEPEKRPYLPHITVARAEDFWRRDAIETFTSTVAQAFGDPFPVDHGVLVSSELGAGGPKYETVASFPLGGS